MLDDIKVAMRAMGDFMLVLQRVRETIATAQAFIASPAWRDTVREFRDAAAPLGELVDALRSGASVRVSVIVEKTVDGEVTVNGAPARRIEV